MVGASRIYTNIRLASAVLATADRIGMSERIAFFVTVDSIIHNYPDENRTAETQRQDACCPVAKQYTPQEGAQSAHDRNDNSLLTVKNSKRLFNIVSNRVRNISVNPICSALVFCEPF